MKKAKRTMRLQSISFSAAPKNRIGWSIDGCALKSINLISGKNSSGKTRLLKSIYTLASILTSSPYRIAKDTSFYWDIELADGENNIKFAVQYSDNKFIKEELIYNGELYLKRNSEGKGKILYEELGLDVEFEIDLSKSVIASKRDKKQHPSIESFFIWAENLYMYKFGTMLGRDTLMSVGASSDVSSSQLLMLNKDDEAVVAKFTIGIDKFGDKFKRKVLQDLKAVGYNVDDISTITTSLPKDSPPDSALPNLIYIIEHGIKDKIFQVEISQGMFRVISLLIQLNYLELNISNNNGATILIDDIGEGLDFERSSNLIKLIISKVESIEEKVQLIMTTNDKFVMNIVPLKYWLIADKEYGKIKFYSQDTNKKEFDDFEFIGLNNFDFFSGEYYKPASLSPAIESS